MRLLACPAAFDNFDVDWLVGDWLAVPVHRDEVDAAVFVRASNSILRPRADVEQTLMHDKAALVVDGLPAFIADGGVYHVAAAATRIARIAMQLEARHARRIGAQFTFVQQTFIQIEWRPAELKRLADAKVIIAVTAVCEPVFCADHAVLRLRIGNYAAKEILARDLKVRRATLHDLRLIGRERNLELRQTIFGHLEVNEAVFFIFAVCGQFDQQGPCAGRSLRRQVELAMEAARFAQRQFQFASDVILRVAEGNGHAVHVRRRIAQIVFHPRQPAEVDRLPAAIDRAVGVDINGVLALKAPRVEAKVPGQHAL